VRRRDRPLICGGHVSELTQPEREPYLHYERRGAIHTSHQSVLQPLDGNARMRLYVA
jgi:hypothetical protein